MGFNLINLWVGNCLNCDPETQLILLEPFCLGNMEDSFNSISFRSSRYIHINYLCFELMNILMSRIA